MHKESECPYRNGASEALAGPLPRCLPCKCNRIKIYILHLNLHGTWLSPIEWIRECTECWEVQSIEHIFNARLLLLQVTGPFIRRKLSKSIKQPLAHSATVVLASPESAPKRSRNLLIKMFLLDKQETDSSSARHVRILRGYNKRTGLFKSRYIDISRFRLVYTTLDILAYDWSSLNATGCFSCFRSQEFFFN